MQMSMLNDDEKKNCVISMKRSTFSRIQSSFPKVFLNKVEILLDMDECMKVNLVCNLVLSKDVCMRYEAR